MKKILLTLTVMLASVATYAQHAVGTITLQPKVGMNVASLTKMEGSDPRIGLAAGAEFEYQATDIFSISAGALYSMQGGKFDKSVKAFGVKQNGSLTMKEDYINIPVMANVYVLKGLAVKLGVQPGFNVHSSTKLSTSGAIGEGKQSIDTDAKSFDFSIPVGMSYEYNNVVLDARYNWGLTKVFDNADAKNSVFQITLGYKFEL